MNTERKVVVITGASQGIGASLVKAFRDLNYRVIANSRSISDEGDDNILAVSGDISVPETAERIVREGLDRFGRIDSLVNNAGIFLSKPFTKFTQQDFAQNISVNVAGFFNVTQCVAAQMMERGSGHIVTITTSLVDQPIVGLPSVLASLTKGGLNSATKSLAMEFSGSGIRVNAVSPGVIKTPMHPVETHAGLAGLHPVKRMGEISDVVDAVLYLESAPFVTGEILHVDGGQNAGRW